MLGAVHDRELNPPLYDLVAWFWVRAFGDGDLGLISLSALIGTATVPVVYLCGRELCGRRAGLIAAALTAVNPFLVWYSQEARAYALLCLLAALMLLFFLRALERTPQERGPALVAWALASVAALATHYFAFVAIVPEAVVLIAVLRPRRPALLATGGVALAGAALLPLALDQRERTGWISHLPFDERLGAVPQHFLTGFYAPFPLLPVLACLVVAAIVIYALAGGDAHMRRAILIPAGLALAGIVIVLAGALAHNDLIITRNLIGLWPAAMVAVAVALAAPRLAGAGTGIAAGLAALCLALTVWTGTDPDSQRLDWGGAAAAAGRPQQPRVVIGDRGYNARPLVIYLDGATELDLGPGPDPPTALPRHAPPSPPVRELVLILLRPVASDAIGACWWGSLCGGHGNPDLLAGVPPAFKRVETTRLDRFDVIRFVARHPTRVPILDRGAFAQSQG